jgi:hypothetical protein
VQERGLARTARPDEGHEISLPHIEADAAQGMDGHTLHPVRPLDVDGLNYRHGHGSSR